jgi:hypothetical protein
VKHALKLVISRPSEKLFGSQRFIDLTRNTSLVSPTKFEPTVKASGDVVI